MRLIEAMKAQGVLTRLSAKLRLRLWSDLLLYSDGGGKALSLIVIFVGVSAVAEMAIFSSLIIFLAQISPGSGQTVLENEVVIAILAYFEHLTEWISLDLVFLILIVLMLTLRELSRFFVLILNRRGMSEIEFNLRSKLISSLLNAEYLCTDQVGAGVFTEMIGMKTSDSSKLYQFISQFSSLFFTILTYFMVVLIASPATALTAVCLALIFYFAMGKPLRLKKNLAEKSVDLSFKLSQRAERLYAMRRSIKVDDLIDFERKQSEKLARSIYSVSLRAERAGALLMGSLTVGVISSLLVITLFLLKEGFLDIVLISTGLLMLMRVLPLIMGVNRMRNVIVSYSPSFLAVHQAISTFQSHRERLTSNASISKGPKTFNISSLDFRYNNANSDVLKNINVDLIVGQTTSLVGRSGAGKSTVIDLLTRLYNFDKGRILLNGIDIRDLGLPEYRSLIAYYPQDAAIFDGSLLYNLRIRNPEASLDKINKVIEITGLDKLLKELPRGYDTIIGSEGLKLSGGQRQRLALCSILLKDSKICLLDEPTSALDEQNAQRLVTFIKSLACREKKLVIIVSHQWSVVRQLDRMIKLEAGTVIYDGPPDKQKFD